MANFADIWLDLPISRECNNADKHREAGYKICRHDACAKRDSPTAQRGIRTRGGSETVGTNYSKKSIQILGVLGENAFNIMFSRTYKSEDTMRMIDHVYKKIRKVVHAARQYRFQQQSQSEKSRGGHERRGGAKYNLPHTPQLNPIEPQRLVVKGAVGGTYFGDFQSMQIAIRNAMERGGNARGAPA